MTVKDEMRRWGAFGAVMFVTRVLSGLVWANGAFEKPPPAFGWFPGWIDKEIAYGSIRPYQWFLVNVLKPHLTFFGYVQFATELFLGIVVTLGILVGLTSLLATFWAANIALGSYPVPGEVLYYLAFFVLVPLILATGRAGRFGGLDATIRPRLLGSSNPWVRRLGEWGT